MRIAVTGFRTARGVEVFLERAGWQGEAQAVCADLSFFEERGAFACLDVHFDIAANGGGPRLGLSFFAREQEWLKDIRFWKALIDCIGERGYELCCKLEALSERSTGSTVLLMSWSGPIMLVQGIHHIKLGMTGEWVEEAKPYLFFLMMCYRPKCSVAKG